jgi:hypothetical protein
MPMNMDVFQLNDRWDEDKFQEDGLRGKNCKDWYNRRFCRCSSGCIVGISSTGWNKHRNN